MFIYRNLLIISFTSNNIGLIQRKFMFKYLSNIRKVFIGPKGSIKKDRTLFNFILIVFLLLNLLIVYFSLIKNFKNKIRVFNLISFSSQKKSFIKKFINVKGAFSYKLKFFININNIFNLVFLKINNFKLFFLRKNVIYIKSKFSKSRLVTKSIVYFSLILNFIVINELHYIYYNISINYSYLYLYFFIIFIDVVFSFFKRNKSGSLIEEQRSSKPLILVQVQSTLACSAILFYMLIL